MFGHATDKSTIRLGHSGAAKQPPLGTWAKVGFALAGALLLSACARIIPNPQPPIVGPVSPSANTAALAGIASGPSVSSLGMSASDAASALSSFTESCRWLTRRDDASGLTQPADWQPACTAADGWQSSRADEFFDRYFETAKIGDGKAFATGYFEPEISASRSSRAGYAPVYGVPSDLTRGWPSDVPTSERTGRAPRGRVNEDGEFVRYYTRAEIEDGALQGKAPVIAYAVDPVELFFLQIQGSGRLRTENGEVIRIGYASQNGRGYTGIGGVMRERGLLGDGPGQYPGSMQGIMSYIRENPAEGKALMRLNESWVFFRELTGDGPLGSLGVPVRRESSVAVDPKFVPYGAPVWLDLDRDIADGMWIAQDTGGAIKGANRFDTFWGAGADAREIAGGMSGRGSALVLLPKGVVARVKASLSSGQ